MEGREFEFTFTSEMSKAQELLAYSGLDTFMQTAGGILAAEQNAADKIDFDELLDIARKRDGLPSRMIRDDKQVEELREKKAQAAQQAAEQQRIAGAADVANKLGNTPLDAGNALGAAMGMEGGPGIGG